MKAQNKTNKQMHHGILYTTIYTKYYASKINTM